MSYQWKGHKETGKKKSVWLCHMSQIWKHTFVHPSFLDILQVSGRRNLIAHKLLDGRLRSSPLSFAALSQVLNRYVYQGYLGVGRLAPKGLANTSVACLMRAKVGEGLYTYKKPTMVL